VPLRKNINKKKKKRWRRETRINSGEREERDRKRSNYFEEQYVTQKGAK
jgi:hypothetical protein